MKNTTKQLRCQAEKERILVKVLKIKRQQFQEKYGYEPNKLELDNFEDWEDRLEVRPWCDRKNHVLFRDILTNRVKPFRCNQLRCGCPECTKGYMNKRKEKIKQAIVQHNLDKMWTITLNPETVAGETKDEKRVNAWAMLPNLWSRLRKAIVHLVVKRIWAKKEEVVFVHWLEPHKNLMPHIHIYTNQYLPHEDLERLCKKYGLGASHQKKIKASKNTVRDMSEYSSKLILSPTEETAQKLAEYAAKEAKKSGEEIDEKFFDKRAIHYILKRMRLIGFTRNIKVKKEEKEGVSPWVLMVKWREIEIPERMKEAVIGLLGKVDIKQVEISDFLPIEIDGYREQLQRIIDILEGKEIKANKTLHQDIALLKAANAIDEKREALVKEIELYKRQVVIRKLAEKYTAYLSKLQDDYRIRAIV